MNNQEPKSDWGTELERLLSEFLKAMEEGNISRSSVYMNALWVMFQIYATSVQPNSKHLEELTYLKAPFSFDNGGKYVLMFTHIDGPKIQLRDNSGSVYTKTFEEIK